MKALYPSLLVLTLGASACAHAPQPYRFTTQQTANDLDIVVRTLEGNGLQPAQIDRRNRTVTTLWFDTGYRFRDIDDFRNLDYYTDVFLRYRVDLQRHGNEDTVVLATDVQRCSPTDSVVTPAGVIGSCQPMTILLPTHQRRVQELGEQLRSALDGPRAQTWRVATVQPRR